MLTHSSDPMRYTGVIFSFIANDSIVINILIYNFNDSSSYCVFQFNWGVTFFHGCSS